MNKIVKSVLIFSAGVAMGAFVGYVITKRKNDKTIDEIVEKEVASVREALKASIKRKEEKIIKDVQDIGEEMSATVETEEKPKRTVRTRRGYKDKVKELGYFGDVDEYHDAEEQEKEDEYLDAESRNNNAKYYISDGSPRVITIEQYSEECDDYDKLTIYYYNDDDTLADDQDEIIVDISAVVGDEALVCFGLGSKDNDVVYVRNDRLRIDYEVIRQDKSYRETVLGIPGGD